MRNRGISQDAFDIILAERKQIAEKTAIAKGYCCRLTVWAKRNNTANTPILETVAINVVTGAGAPWYTSAAQR